MNLGLDFSYFTFWVSFRHLRLAPDGVLSYPKELHKLWKVPKYISSTSSVLLQGFCPIKRVIVSPGARIDPEVTAPEVLSEQ